MNDTSDHTATTARDAALANRARGVFRDACDATDVVSARRLAQARRAALATRATPHRVHVSWLAPLAGAAACCAFVVGMVWLQPNTRVAPTTAHRSVATVPTASVAAIAAITPIASGGDDVATEVDNGQMDMVQNLDFYRWLATQPTLAAAHVGSGQ